MLQVNIIRTGLCEDEFDYHIASITNTETGGCVIVPEFQRADLDKLQSDCLELFGYGDNVRFVNTWEPPKPDDKSLEIGRNLYRFAKRNHVENDKLGLIQAFRGITFQGLKESKDVIEYVMLHPEF